MQVRSGICPAVLSKRDRICKKMLCSSASQVRSGICPAALSKWDRICKKMLCSSASQVRSGICPAVLSKWDRICKKTLYTSASQIFGAKWHLPCSAWQMGSYLQEDAHLRPTQTSHCSRRRRAPSRHRSALFWNSATRVTMDSGGPRSKISRGGGRKRSRSPRGVTLKNMTYKWSHQLSSSNSGKRAQSTIVPVRRVKP